MNVYKPNSIIVDKTDAFVFRYNEEEYSRSVLFEPYRYRDATDEETKYFLLSGKPKLFLSEIKPLPNGNVEKIVAVFTEPYNERFLISREVNAYIKSEYQKGIINNMSVDIQIQTSLAGTLEMGIIAITVISTYVKQ